MTARLCATHPQIGEKLVFRLGVKHSKCTTLVLDRKELAEFQAVVEGHLGMHLRSLTIQIFKMIETTKIYEVSDSSDAEGKIWHTRKDQDRCNPTVTCYDFNKDFEQSLTDGTCTTSIDKAMTRLPHPSSLTILPPSAPRGINVKKLEKIKVR